MTEEESQDDEIEEEITTDEDPIDIEDSIDDDENPGLDMEDD